MKGFLTTAFVFFSVAASAQTKIEPVYNIPIKGDSYRYEVARGTSRVSAGHAEAENKAILKIQRLQAKRLSLPSDCILVEPLGSEDEIWANTVYEMCRIEEQLKGGRTRVTIVYLVPKIDTKLARTNLKKARKRLEKLG